jgi:ribA/ribD-fused uncharacterized protein
MKNVDFNNLPEVLTQEIIDMIVPMVKAQTKEWHELAWKLTSEQRSQVYNVLDAEQKALAAEWRANATQDQKDAMRRAGAIHGARDHYFVTIFDEYDLVNGTGYYKNLSLEQIKQSSPVNYAYKTIEFRRSYMTKDEQFTFFDGKSPFSMCFPAKMVIHGLEFSSSLHYAVYKKAEQFLDREKMDVILATTDPEKLLELSRSILYFEKQVWDMVLKVYLMTGIREKFLQHETLMRQLKATKGTTLVLVDVDDAKWGVGLDLDANGLFNRAFWRGKNLLGELITEIRFDLTGEY